MGDFLIEIINYLIAGVGTVLGWLLSLFPDSPFKSNFDVPPNVTLSYIAWLIPFNQMFLHFILILEAILSFYLIRVLGRWIKIVRD